MAPTVTKSRALLEAERDRVLKQLGSTLDDFRVAVRTRSLTADEWAAREELEEIEFLLGDDDLGD